ncbi:MAG: amidohydrolase [Sphingomonadales bacterium]
MAETLSESIQSDYEYLGPLFEYFHENPELSFSEHNTSNRLAAELEAEGFEVVRGIASTGLVGIMRNGDGPTVMIRADMDGLPVEEKTGLPYASSAMGSYPEDDRVFNVMHACGHDMHMTSLVGVARQMAARNDQWSGTLLLLGQPAEEAIGGAKAMVEDDLWNRVPRADYALGLHVNSTGLGGEVAFSDGLMLSSADTMRIVVPGVGTHGAQPHRGKDPVVIGSQIVMALQTIITRDISPLEPGIITVGAFHSGTAPNIISDQAVLDITVRANSEETRWALQENIERVAINIGRAAGLPEDNLPVVTHLDGVPTTINDAALAQRLHPVIEEKLVGGTIGTFTQLGMGAEDYPYLVRVDPPIPSVYFLVGGAPAAAYEASINGGPALTGHHSPIFVIDPTTSVPAGVEAMTIAALELLGNSD